ncbi:TAXI family TRAP transporter solute-binding subunit [Pseudonocardia sp. GCM10023141]|uniref:TAXI family TRAP transporter solute-binding subunit n=1 Tax=Pseudonocardia sp. GCM10023141 TaxID=3252653 RepID=UPI0036083DCB
MISRRTLLLGAAALAGLTACTSTGTVSLTVAAGESGGFYVEFGGLLVKQLQEQGLTAAVVETGGTVDNIGLLTGGRANLALALADVAGTALTGSAPFTAPVPLVALGRVYENYMQFVVRAEDPIAGAADLVGKRVSLGAMGSGAAVFGERLLAVAGIAAEVSHRPLREAVDALGAGRSDALLWSGGVPTPALAELAARRPIRLLPLAAHLPELQAAFGSAYGPVSVPAGAYGPAPGVPTVGVANLLIAMPTLPDEVAGEVVRTLVQAAPALVPTTALGTQYLDQRSLIGTGDVPLHPGAMAAYRALHG